MDFHRSKPQGQRPPFSVLEGEGSFFRKILSREPSIGNSNGYYLYRSPGQIPFQWERQPGKCKFDPPKEVPVDIPRINPPPISASRSMELPSRLNHGCAGPKGSSPSWLKMRFWRKIKNKKPQLTMPPRSKNQARGSDAMSECGLSGLSCASSDDNFMSSSSNSSSSSSASSSSASSLSLAIIKLGKRT
ncbi:uncharacterized protein LOC115744519 [Rhodamnia argentea]|uniref:Uncharacterized protein LOC115744519 n=1 Tax=Rhodamnia argentea TaxID=178133 RepID=A0A8B8PLC0_9MYRT|nr:uncharacterized protein LOC115744519 [Rhodamnia argentea]